MKHSLINIHTDFPLLPFEETAAAQCGEELYRQYFDFSGITIEVIVDWEPGEDRFLPYLNLFRTQSPGADLVSIRHYGVMPVIDESRLKTRLYEHPPWKIFQFDDAWVYLQFVVTENQTEYTQLAVFNKDYSRARIYRNIKNGYQLNNQHALTMTPTDQILFAHLLADRSGFLIHASGMIIDGKGVLFAGHSGAGKSTIAKILKHEGELLCDDRIAVRRWEDGFRIHGTWSHGELPDVSNNSAPLKGIFFLEQAEINALVPIIDIKERFKRLLPLTIKSLETADWWRKVFDNIEQISAEASFYRLQFDKSGKIISILKKFLEERSS